MRQPLRQRVPYREEEDKIALRALGKSHGMKWSQLLERVMDLLQGEEPLDARARR